jgi:hypothetical protein
MSKAMGDLRLWDFITMVIILAIVYGLVRPGSKAAQAVNDVTTALVALVGAATGYQSTSSSAQTGTDLTTV